MPPGVEPYGSTAHRAEREDIAPAIPQGNPSPTTTLIIKELRQKVATPFLFYNLNLINSDQLKITVIKKNSRTFVVPSLKNKKQSEDLFQISFIAIRTS